MASTTFVDRQTVIEADWLNAINRGHYEDRVNVKDFGAVGDGIKNDTAAIREALAALRINGGGTCYFPSGTYSVASVEDVPWCLQIPANTIVSGESRGSTIITRLNIEEASILLVNADADTASGYNAAGNITIENLTLRDSESTERSQTTGNIIAFGHGDGLLVRNCSFGKHTQHCLDIGGSKNVKFVNNDVYNTNGLTGYKANSAVQVDSANGSSFIGINIDGTESENVIIQGNSIVSLYTNEVIHIGHNGGTAKNVIISNNYIAGANQPFGTIIRSDQDNANIIDIVIEGNILETFAANNQALISLVTKGNNSEVFKNIIISNNTLKGYGRIGIEVGMTDLFSGSTIGQVENINISNNSVDLIATGSTVPVAGIQNNLCTSSILIGNNIKVEMSTDASIETHGIRAITCDGLIIKNNTITTDLTTYTGTKVTSGIMVDRFGSIATSSTVDVTVDGNSIDVTKFKYGIYSGFAAYGDLFIFSGNRFSGALTNGDAHIYESIPSSDGTNGYKSIDLTGLGNYIQSVAVDTSYSIDTGLIKKARYTYVRSNERIDVTYTSSTLGLLSTDTEKQISNVTDVGFQVSNINPSLGTFDIVTGATANNVTIVQGGADINQTAGTISVQAGI